MRRLLLPIELLPRAGAALVRLALGTIRIELHDALAIVTECGLERGTIRGAVIIDGIGKPLRTAPFAGCCHRGPP